APWADEPTHHRTGTSYSSPDAFDSSATVCRASAGQCDVAEIPTRSSAALPSDRFASATTPCTGTSQAGACDDDAHEHCTGTSNTCTDAFKSSTTVCPGSARQCDVAESCTGTSGACPADAFVAASTECRASA